MIINIPNSDKTHFTTTGDFSSYWNWFFFLEIKKLKFFTINKNKIKLNWYHLASKQCLWLDHDVPIILKSKVEIVVVVVFFKKMAKNKRFIIFFKKNDKILKTNLQFANFFQSFRIAFKRIDVNHTFFATDSNLLSKKKKSKQFF